MSSVEIGAGNEHHPAPRPLSQLEFVSWIRAVGESGDTDTKQRVAAVAPDYIRVQKELGNQIELDGPVWDVMHSRC